MSDQNQSPHPVRHAIILLILLSYVTGCVAFTDNTSVLKLNRNEFINLSNLDLSYDEEYLVYDLERPYKEALNPPNRVVEYRYSSNICDEKYVKQVNHKKLLLTKNGLTDDLNNQSPIIYSAKEQSKIIDNYIVQSEGSHLKSYQLYHDTENGIRCLKHINNEPFNSSMHLIKPIVLGLTISDDGCWLAYYVRERVNKKELSDISTMGFLFDFRHISDNGEYLFPNKVTIYASQIRKGCNEKDIKEPIVVDPIQIHSIENRLFKDGKVRLDISIQDNDKVRIAYESGHTTSSLNGDVLISELIYKNKEWKKSHQNPVNVTTREPVRDGWDGKPKFSPDGKYIAYIRQDVPQDEASMKNIFRKNLETNLHENLTNTLDHPIDEYFWSCNGKCIIAKAFSNARKELYLISLETNNINIKLIKTPNDIPSFIHDFVVTQDGDKIYTISSAFDKPKEVYCLQRKYVDEYEFCGNWKSTNENREFLSANKKHLPEVRQFSVKAENQLGYVPIFLLLPNEKLVKKKRKIPLILSVHGGPTSTQHSVFSLELLSIIANGYAVALPNPTGSLGFGQDYTNAVKNDWGGQVYNDLVTVLDDLVKRNDEYNLDIEKFGAMGGSYGGYMMAWMQSHPPLLQSNKNFKLKAQVAVNGVYDLHSWSRTTDELWYPIDQLKLKAGEFNPYHQFNPAQYNEYFSKIPTLLIAGKLDDRVTIDQSIQFFTALKDNCIPSRLIILPTGKHGFDYHNERLSTASKIAWFDQFLKRKMPNQGPKSHSTIFSNPKEAYLKYTDMPLSENCN